MALLVWLLSSLSSLTLLVAGMRYAVPKDWNYITPNWTLDNPLESDFPLYVMNNGTSNVVSGNGLFALAWSNVSYDNDVRFMLVMQQGSRAVSVLRDRRTLYIGNEVEISDAGNLACYDIDGHLIWQSSPDAVMLPGQLLFTGMELTPQKLIEVADDLLFTLGVVEGGLVMSVRNAYTQNIYQSWSLQEKSACPGSSTVLEYTGSSLVLKYGISDNKSSTCDVPPLFLMNGSSSEQLPFLRLEDNGDLVAYKYSQQENDWVVTSRLSDTWKFSTPSQCGSYGLEEKDHCFCLRTNSRGPCYGRGTLDYSHHVEIKSSIKLDGVSYFGTDLQQPNMTNTTFQNCKHLCSATKRPRCWAAFYNNATLECFLFDEPLLGSLRRDNNMTAILNFYENTTSFWHKSVVRVSISFLILAILIFPLAITGLTYYNRKFRDHEGANVEALLSTMQGLPRRYSYTALAAATRGFTTKLGAGGFGSVYEGFTDDGKHVAVKKLDDNGSQGAKQFVTEVAGMGGISHVNVVKLCGFCIDGATQKLLVYDFMPNGSLDKWLFASGSDTLSWKQRVKIALGTARGLSYLHDECSEPILHFDIKPQNILLDRNFVAKVADFGMAKLLQNRDVTQVYTCVRGTPGYWAPEWVYQNIASKKCDVYSYGMVLLELIGGRKNTDISRMDDEDELIWYFPAWAVDRVKKQQLMEVVDAKVSDFTAKDSAQMMVHLALWCIQENPSRRPSMSQVVEMIEGHAEVEEPPMFFHFETQMFGRSPRADHRWGPGRMSLPTVLRTHANI